MANILDLYNKSSYTAPPVKMDNKRDYVQENYTRMGPVKLSKASVGDQVAKLYSAKPKPVPPKMDNKADYVLNNYLKLKVIK